MQEPMASLFLAENRWVSAAAISGSGNGHGDIHIDLAVSSDGHELIRDRGIHAFELKIQAKLSSIDLQGVPWKVCSPHVDFWGQPGPGTTQGYPLVLSRLDDLPNHSLLVSITPDLDCFQGHFPDNPILAGVTQLHWAVCASRCLYGFDMVPLEVKRLKFKNVVTPPMVLELALGKKSANEVHFRFASPGRVHSEGCLVFGGVSAC